MYHDINEQMKHVIKEKEALTLQTVNGTYLKLQYFDEEVNWHVEHHDEFFFVLDGTVDFTVEDTDYRLKKGDLLVIESGKKHRASSQGCVWLSVVPHSKGALDS